MNRLCCLIVMFIACGVCDAQNVTGFFTTFGNNAHGTISVVGSDNGTSIVSGTNGYVLNADIITCKVSASGNILWAKKIGSANSYESCNASCKTANGNILLGSRWAMPGLQDGMYLVEIDTAGNLVRTRIYPNNFGGAEVLSIIKTADNGFAVTGYYDYAPDTYIMIARFDSSLNMLWQKSSSNYNAEGSSIIQTSDGGFAITGYLAGSNGYLDAFFIKLDSSGSTQWFKTIGFGNLVPERGIAIIQNTNGNYTIAGMSEIVTSGIYKPYFTKFDSLGNLLWARYINITASYEGSAHSLINTADGGYLVAGYTKGQFLIKYDVNDSLQWSTADTAGFSRGLSVIETNDYSIEISGTYYGSYGCISKTDSVGMNCKMVPVNFQFISLLPSVGIDSVYTTLNNVSDSGGVINALTMSSTVQCTSLSVPEMSHNRDNINIYPNPFASKLYISNSNFELSEIILYDIVSRILLQQKFTNSISLSTEQLAKGIYLYVVRNKNGVIKKGKVVKE